MEVQLHKHSAVGGCSFRRSDESFIILVFWIEIKASYSKFVLKFGNFKKKIENFACKKSIHNFRLGECMNLILGGILIQSMVKTCAKYWSLNATRRYPFKRFKNIDFSQKMHFYINFAIFTIAGSYPLDLVNFFIYCRRLISQI